MTTTTEAYGARADEYIDLLGSMSAVHPSDRQLIASWAEQVPGRRVLDAGCGPGHWTDFVTRLGLEARGVDLVPSFIEHARAAFPGIPFDVESIDAIREPDGVLSGVLSWFSTIHHEPDAIATPLAEFARVLRPGGQLVLGFFCGDAVEPFDHAVAHAYRWPPADLRRIVADVGFDVLETHVREERGQRPVAALVCERTTASVIRSEAQT